MNDDSSTITSVAPPPEKALTVPFSDLVRMLEKSFKNVRLTGGSPRNAAASGTETGEDSLEHASPHREFPESNEAIERLIKQLERAWHQRSQLAQLEAELARRIEKLKGQKKSLSRRFRAEWKQIKAAKKELAELQECQPTGDVLSEQTAFTDQTRKLAQSQPLVVGDKSAAERLREENQQLKSELVDEQGRTPGELIEIQTSEMFELKRSLEWTLDELHRLKEENSRLKTNSSSTASSASNWEEMKKAMMDDLEGDSELASRQAPEELAEAVRQSQQLIQQKEDTIQQLQTQLAENQRNIDEQSRSAKREILDENEVVADELKRLDELQQQWREKIGQAEFELSQERARLARDRIQVDEQMEELKEMQEAAANPETPRGRKWREKLGLD